MEREKSLQEIVRLLTVIDEKLAKILEVQKREVLSNLTQEKPGRYMPIDVETLLELPDHLRRTAQVLMELKSATANEVAARTGLSRAAESDYLNQLLKMGHVKKGRKGRIVYFSV